MINTTEEARTDYLTLCRNNNTSATDFEHSVLGAVDDTTQLDEDIETHNSLRLTIACIKGGTVEDGDSVYYGWLYEQLEQTLLDAEMGACQ